MNPDDRFESYLNQRADDIPLRTTPASVIAGRAGHRHRRHRAMALAAVTSVGAVAVAVVVTSGNDKPQSVASGQAPAPLRWSVVTPAAGLGFGSSTAAADGTLYALSTAPGALGTANDPTLPKPTLYRSTDGSEWSTVALPSDLSASGVATAGDALYAVGTAPAGGGRAAVLDSTTDGGSSWSRVTLPLDLAALDATGGGPVIIGAPSVAKGPDGTYVASVSAQASPALAALLPAGAAGPMASYAITPDGIAVYDQCTDSSASCDVKSSSAPAATTYTWDQLGVSPAQQRLYRGEVHVFTSGDGSSFTEQPVAIVGQAPAVFATADGYRLVTTTYETTTGSVQVYRSTDGTAWTDDASFVGYSSGAGLLAGHLSVIVSNPTGTMTLHTESGSSWTDLDVTGGAAGQQAFVESAGFGPLGAVVVVGVSSPSGPVDRQLIVHTTDGSTSTVTDLATIDPTATGQVNGVEVTADAVLVRLSEPSNDPNVVPAQHVLVGTPQ
ncbi:MAG: hypothetical protein QOE63_450 [Acidimicrobiaceae bacterium]